MSGGAFVPVMKQNESRLTGSLGFQRRRTMRNGKTKVALSLSRSHSSGDKNTLSCFCFVRYYCQRLHPRLALFTMQPIDYHEAVQTRVALITYCLALCCSRTCFLAMLIGKEALFFDLCAFVCVCFWLKMRGQSDLYYPF